MSALVPDAPASGGAADLDLILGAVREAGALAMDYFAREVAAWEKAKGDPVSEADLAVNDLLRRRLTEARPHYAWLSEETADDGGRFTAERLFVVDPIDGTRAFLKKRPNFSISVALLEKGEPCLGVVYNPARDELYAAAAGQGATLNGEPIHASGRAKLAGAHLVGYEQMFRHARWRVPWPDLTIAQVNSIAYTLCLVASGWCDGSVSLTPKNDWDIAAASLIVAEAGGRASCHDGTPFRFNRVSLRHPTVVAAGPALYPALLRKLEEFKG